MARKKSSALAKPVFMILILSLGIIFAIGTPTNAWSSDKAQLLVDKASITFDHFINDPNMAWFRKNLKSAKGLFIIPALVKAGFIWGGSGGNGVLLVRDQKTGEWSQPGFYSMGSVSFGLQIGGEVAEFVMLIMTQRGLESLYSTNVKLGGTASVAAGPVGIGAEGSTPLNMSADMVSYIKAKGAFAGAALDGALLKTTDGFNKSYYGKAVRPVDIFVTRNVSNPGSDRLRAKLKAASMK